MRILKLKRISIIILYKLIVTLKNQDVLILCKLLCNKFCEYFCAKKREIYIFNA